jgi:hypothetical protein
VHKAWGLQGGERDLGWRSLSAQRLREVGQEAHEQRGDIHDHCLGPRDTARGLCKTIPHCAGAPSV